MMEGRPSHDGGALDGGVLLSCQSMSGWYDEPVTHLQACGKQPRRAARLHPSLYPSLYPFLHLPMKPSTDYDGMGYAASRWQSRGT